VPDARRQGAGWSAGVVSVSRACVVGGAGGGPAGEQFEPVGGGGARVGGVEVEAQTGFGGGFHGLEVEVEFADGGMAESFAAAAVEFDVVRGPVLAEQLALGREFADEGFGPESSP